MNIMATSKMNPDISKERNAISFKLQELTEILDGGPGKTQFRKRIEKLLFTDPIFRDLWKVHFLSRSQQYELGVAIGVKLFKLRTQYNWTQEQFKVVEGCVQFINSLSLHLDMFLPAIERLGTVAQKKKWLPLALNFKLIGTYAQTEIGHGTFLRGLETTARYDPSKEEFVLNTPQLSSMKWWPGSLGRSSTHAIVLAILYVKGKNCGMQAFILQLRKLSDHSILPGIEVGDIGPKMSMNAADNGYLILRNVRVPRENMLMKYAEVSKDGVFSSAGPDKITYGAMTYVRVQITYMSYYFLRSAVTIAIRYSAVRRQSKLVDNEPEPQVLDFQTQQYKLFPSLANCYAIFFTSKYLLKLYNEMMEKITTKGDFQSLNEIHSLSSGLKARTTKLALEGISICRTACGGHGYLMVAGLSTLLGNIHALYTAEGEYTVMSLQTARYLIKEITKVMSGQMVEGTSAYLNDNPKNYACPIRSPNDCLKEDVICSVFKNRASRIIRHVAVKLQTDKAPKHIAMNNNLQSLVRVSKVHCQTIMIVEFVNAIKSLTVSHETTQVLKRLCQLYALHTITLHSGDFLETGSLDVEQLQWIREKEEELVALIRPDAVPLVDAFDIHDETLGSLLGVYDGNVYERLYESTKSNPLNQSEVHQSYHKYLRPLLTGEINSKL